MEQHVDYKDLAVIELSRVVQDYADLLSERTILAGALTATRAELEMLAALLAAQGITVELPCDWGEVGTKISSWAKRVARRQHR